MFKYLADKFRPTARQRPIIVVSGLPRSGTSMMMKMLEAGGIPVMTDQIRTADVDNPKGYYEFERVKKLPKGDIAWLADARGKAVKIIAALLVHLPNNLDYQIIIMKRAVPEILASQKRMLRNRGEDPDKVSDEELAKLFEKHLAMVYSWLDSQPKIKYVNVDYNQLVHKPEPEVERLSEFLTNGLDVASMVQIIDPKLYRQRR